MFSVITKKFVDARFRLQDDKGATAVEYGLIVGGIAVAIIVAVGLLGGTISDMFDDIREAL